MSKFRFDSNYMFAALGFGGTGAIVIWPDAKWIGWGLIGIAIVVLVFGIRISDSHFRIGRPRMNLYFMLMGIGALLFMGALAAYLIDRSNERKPSEPQSTATVPAAVENEKNGFNLEGLIEQYIIEVRTPVDPNNPIKEMFVIYAQMSITNLGVPSIAKGFRGAVESDQGVLLGLSMVMEDGHILKGAANTSIEIKTSDALFEKSEMVPIPTGGLTRGFLCFTFPNVLRERLTSPTAKLVINFQDARGHKYTSEISLKDHKKPYVLRHFSGGPQVQVLNMPENAGK